MENDRKSSYRKCSQTLRSTENTKYTKTVGKIEKKCRKGLEFKVYLNDTLIPEGNIREEFQDGKSKKVTLSDMLFAIGLILGWQYGLAVGFLLPFVRSVLFGMPVLYPNAIAMAFEMGTYGLVAGWLYSHAKWQRTKERYEEPGGNVDYKRFEQEVLVPLKKGETVFYRPYYPPKWSFLETAEIAPCRVNIVEGTYSCHERLEAYYDMKVFLTIDPIEQIQRIEKRNGSEKAVEFQKKWIPLEELYFEKCRTRSRCDVCFTMCDEM